MMRVLHWNGRTIPKELRKLPAGDYIVAAYHAPNLTAEEEEGIIEAIASIDRGEGISGEKVHAELRAKTKQRPRARRK